MAHNYIVTAQKATAVSACVTGNERVKNFLLFYAKTNFLLKIVEV